MAEPDPERSVTLALVTLAFLYSAAYVLHRWLS